MRWHFLTSRATWPPMQMVNVSFWLVPNAHILKTCCALYDNLSNTSGELLCPSLCSKHCYELLPASDGPALMQCLISSLQVKSLTLWRLLSSGAETLECTAHTVLNTMESCSAAGFIRWTCWNTGYLLLTVMAHGSMPWQTPAGIHPEGVRLSFVLADARICMNP